MSYERVVTPRIYTDTVRYLLAKGWATSSITTIAGTLNSGSNILDLFNGRPGQRVSFDTSANATTHLIIQIDMGASYTSNPINFCALLNGNFVSAEVAAPQIRHHTSAFTGPGEGTQTTDTYPIGGVDTGVVTMDGSLIMTFSEVTNKRYWAIELPDDSSFSATDFQLGGIVLGYYYDFPYSPDLELVRRHEFGGIDRRDTAGGQTWSTARFAGGPGDSASSFGQPFRVFSTDYRKRMGSRRVYDMTFSRLADTDTHPQKSELGNAGNAVALEAWERTMGPHIPFVFAPDGAGSNDYGDHLYARFDQDELSMTQTAPRTWSMGLTIREEF